MTHATYDPWIRYFNAAAAFHSAQMMNLDGVTPQGVQQSVRTRPSSICKRPAGKPGVRKKIKKQRSQKVTVIMDESYLNKGKLSKLNKIARPKKDQVWIWGAVVDGASDTNFIFRILEHPSDAMDGKPRGEAEMLANLHLLGLKKGMRVVSDGWLATVAAVKKFRRAKGWSEADLPHEVVNHEKKELVNKNGYSSNAIEAKWSVLKRWIKKTRGGKLPSNNNRADWRKLVHEFHYRKIMSKGHSNDGGHTFIVPLSNFCQTLAMYGRVP